MSGDNSSCGIASKEIDNRVKYDAEDFCLQEVAFVATPKRIHVQECALPSLVVCCNKYVCGYRII